MKKLISTFGVLSLCLILSGCFGRVQPVYNVFNHPIPQGAQSLSLKDIGDVIRISASKRQWLVEEKEPGLFTMVHRKKTHVAVVEIQYNQNSYSIKYNDSTDLLYNGRNIHRNYNRWVANLELDIETNLQIAAVGQ